MKKNFLFLGFCCLILTFTACQKDEVLTEAVKESPILERICATEAHMASQMADETFRADYEARMKIIEAASQERRALCSTPKLIPVAIHYQGLPDGYDEACLRTLAQNQINILNADYQGNNSDISTWINTASATFPGIDYAETCVRFCIADKNHPAGFNLTDGDPAVTFNQTSGDRDNAWAGYINIFVRNIGGGILGYSELPGKGNGDGMVVNRTAFGSGTGCGVVAPSAPFNLGRTLTHEMGHYLNLRHIWGDGPCGASDFVDDTPPAAASNGGCPAIGKQSCNTADLHMNYMDYTNDACMYMFTAGQAARAEALVNTLGGVLSNAFNVCSVAPNPTCNDGIKNGTETGIDCGGSCGPCGQTCDNGLKDGDETGVDCGGSCPNTCNSGGGGNPCSIATNKYVTLATENAVEIKDIARLLMSSDNRELQVVLKKMVKHQDKVIDVMLKLQSDPEAKQLMKDLIQEYKTADQSRMSVNNSASAKLINYLTKAKVYTNGDVELNLIIDDAIKLVE